MKLNSYINLSGNESKGKIRANTLRSLIVIEAFRPYIFFFKKIVIKIKLI